MSTCNAAVRRLIIGVGNELLGDEGLGVHVARDLASRRTRRQSDDIVDAGTALFDVASQIPGHDEVIIVDAIRAGGDPGTVYRMDDASELLECTADRLPASLHEWTAVDMLRSLRMIGIEIPRLTLIGAEPERIAPCTDLSPRVREAAERIVALLMASEA